MKISNYKRCAFVLRLNPFEIGIIVFLRTFTPWVILLQIDPASSDEPETVYESCYKTKDIFIFAWF